MCDSRIDELSMMTYLSQFPSAQFNQDLSTAGNTGTALSFIYLVMTYLSQFPSAQFNQDLSTAGSTGIEYCH